MGQISVIHRGSGTDSVVDTTYTFDEAGRLAELTHVLSAGSSDPDAVRAGYTYAYDAASRITGIVNQLFADESVDLTNDATGQLTGADRTGTANDESYDYDANGNRDSAGYTTEAHNRTTGDGTFDYTYDAEGNRASKTRISSAAADDHSVEYVWDHRNRLQTVVVRDETGAVTRTIDYRYDVFDHLIGRTLIEGATSTDARFVYDGDQIVLDFIAGDLSHRYLWGPTVDQLLAQEDVGATNVLLWMLGDHQNTTRDVLAQDGALVNHLSYDSFGRLLSSTDVNGDPLAPTNNFRYTARWFDDAANLQNNHHRWYDPTLGKWTSEDPIGFAAGDANIGRYVLNMVTQYVDPCGLQVYDFRGGNIYNTGFAAGGYLKAGDKVIFGLGTITVQSDNLETKERIPQNKHNRGRGVYYRTIDPDYRLAQCVLAKLGLPLPITENGVYWAAIPWGNDGHTAMLSGIGFEFLGMADDINLSFISSHFRGSSNDPDGGLFLELLVTIYHEVKGHNSDEATHETPADEQVFNNKYEKPVFDAVAKAKANGLWKKIVEDAQSL